MPHSSGSTDDDHKTDTRTSAESSNTYLSVGGSALPLGEVRTALALIGLEENISVLEGDMQLDWLCRVCALSPLSPTPQRQPDQR